MASNRKPLLEGIAAVAANTFTLSAQACSGDQSDAEQAVTAIYSQGAARPHAPTPHTGQWADELEFC